jgi:DNA-binding IclR family transcriptional regulator
LAAAVLERLQRDTLTAPQLAARLGVPLSTAQAACKRLEKRGEVEFAGMDDHSKRWRACTGRR